MTTQTLEHQAGPDHAFPVLSQGGVYRALGKRIIDVTFVLITFPLALLFIGIPFLMLWREGGSPFYRQMRLGQNGDQFSILKLRTMVRDADQILERTLAADPALRHEWNTTQKLKNDPRITRVGAFLRKTSLDELPQLWNVFLGEMSLVGPRPMLPEQLPLYGDAHHYFALRPGITGLWQVSNRNESHFQLRMTLDATYHYELSFIEDIRIMWRTFGAVLRRTGY
ncbi:sugar transferase [Roseovarius sp. LXJ103]|uniref:sugar transferase n=1 Tax=Roseovarius carneus TaxID=2853164 RepID=UPI000D609D34|nr:sugar transferase [Roseovarius carneus]PWE37201.1 sugar transferase [Pelagicola sp. LXJ1103]